MLASVDVEGRTGHRRIDHQMNGNRRDLIGASLLIPLADVTATETGGSLVLYAGTPGAFVDLAADLTYALQIGHDALVLNAHLTPSFDDTGLDGFADMTHINQAIGILIERGHTPTGARTELHHLASQAETTVRVAAHQLIHAVTRRPGFEQA